MDPNTSWKGPIETERLFLIFRDKCADVFEKRIDEVAENISKAETFHQSSVTINSYKNTMSRFIAVNGEKSEKNRQRSFAGSLQKKFGFNDDSRLSNTNYKSTLLKKTFLDDKKRAAQLIVDFLFYTRGSQNYGVPMYPVQKFELIKILLDYDEEGITQLFNKSLSTAWNSLLPDQKIRLKGYITTMNKDLQIAKAISGLSSTMGGKRSTRSRRYKRRSSRRM